MVWLCLMAWTHNCWEVQNHMDTIFIVHLDQLDCFVVDSNKYLNDKEIIQI